MYERDSSAHELNSRLQASALDEASTKASELPELVFVKFDGCTEICLSFND